MLKNFLKKRNTDNTPLERYLAHLDKLFQVEPHFFANDSLIEGLPGVTSIVYSPAGVCTGRNL